MSNLSNLAPSPAVGFEALEDRRVFEALEALEVFWLLGVLLISILLIFRCRFSFSDDRFDGRLTHVGLCCLCSVRWPAHSYLHCSSFSSIRSRLSSTGSCVVGKLTLVTMPSAVAKATDRVSMRAGAISSPAS